MNDRESGWTAIRHWVIRGDYFDTMSEEVVYITLVDHSDANNLCYPSIALLSKECKCSKQTVINALRGLEAKGLITKETRVSENGTKKPTYTTSHKSHAMYPQWKKIKRFTKLQNRLPR